jgi:hypothetical protein
VQILKLKTISWNEHIELMITVLKAKDKLLEQGMLLIPTTSHELRKNES